MPKRYWTATPEQIRDDRLRVSVESVVETAPQWLAASKGFYLCGPLNAGKSCVAAMLLMAAVRRFQQCLWLSVRDVPGVRFKDTDHHAMLDERLRTCDLLVLDDLGAERFKRTGPAASALEETARIVYDNNRSLIVTSNFSWRQLGEEYGQINEPLVSVLRRMVSPWEVLNDQWPLEPM
jgi:DNA replication protein DnaC